MLVMLCDIHVAGTVMSFIFLMRKKYSFVDKYMPRPLIAIVSVLIVLFIVISYEIEKVLHTTLHNI